jgi:tape measure domain-containing protein
MDLAEIGLKADSSSLKAADKALDDFSASAKQAGKSADQFAVAETKATTATGKLKNSIASLNTPLTLLKASLGGIAAGLGLSFLQRATDGYTQFGNRLRVAGVEGEAFVEVENRLFDAANRNGQQINSVATLYQKASQAGKDLGATQEQLLQFVDGVTAALKVNGGSAESASGALMQLGQALGGGTVRAEEFNSILEGAPTIAQAAADGIEGIGGSVSKLRNEVINGNISSQEFFEGFNKGALEMQKTASGLDMTIGAAFTTLTNGVMRFIGTIDQLIGGSSLVAQGISAIGLGLNFLAQNIGAIMEALVPFLPAIVGVFGPYVLGMVLTLATAIGVTLYGAVASLFLLIVANPISVFLIAIVTLLGYIVDWREGIAGLIKIWGMFVYEWNAFWGNEAGARRGVEIVLNADKAVADLYATGDKIRNDLTNGFQFGSDGAAQKIASAMDQGGAAAAARIAKATANAGPSDAQIKAQYEYLNGAVIKPLGDKFIEGGKYIYNQVTGGIETGSGNGAAVMKTGIEMGGSNAGSSIGGAMQTAGVQVGSSLFNTLVAAGDVWISTANQFLGTIIMQRIRRENELLAAQASKLNAEAKATRMNAGKTLQEIAGTGTRGGGATSTMSSSGGSRSSTSSGVSLGSRAPATDWSIGAARFAQGGEFMVGGNGGTDSQQVSFRASPNEKVIVQTPAQQQSNDNQPKVDLHLTNVWDPANLVSAMRTQGGRKELINFARANKEELQRILGVSG